MLMKTFTECQVREAMNLYQKKYQQETARQEAGALLGIRSHQALVDQVLLALKGPPPQ